MHRARTKMVAASRVQPPGAVCSPRSAWLGRKLRALAQSARRYPHAGVRSRLERIFLRKQKRSRGRSHALDQRRLTTSGDGI